MFERADINSLQQGISEEGARPSHHRSNWFAAYTRARHEKRIAERFQEKSVEYFLPTYKVVHQWSNRRADVVLPLFPGYIFVCISLRDKIKVLEVPGIVRLVGSNGLPISVPVEEIRLLQERITGRHGLQSHPYLPIGKAVRIKNGPFSSLEGILVRKKNNCRVVLSLHSIGRSFSIEVIANDIEPL